MGLSHVQADDAPNGTRCDHLARVAHSPLPTLLRWLFVGLPVVAAESGDGIYVSIGAKDGMISKEAAGDVGFAEGEGAAGGPFGRDLLQGGVVRVGDGSASDEQIFAGAGET